MNKEIVIAIEDSDEEFDLIAYSTFLVHYLYVFNIQEVNEDVVEEVIAAGTDLDWEWIMLYPAKIINN